MEMTKRLQLGAKKHRKDAAACATKRKAEKEGTPRPSSNNARKKKAQTQTGKTQEKDEPSQAAREVKTPRKDGPPQEVQATKKPKKVGPPQGTRKVPEAGDKHGCSHSGLLALLPLERKYLQTGVKVGGWLHETPCFDCEKNEGGGDNRVLDVADLLNVKGRGGLGVCCNCGPVGHNMMHEEEPGRKEQWACNMVFCMDCFNSRNTRMGDASDGGKRTRRKKGKD
jgi:hypothetical protein